MAATKIENAPVPPVAQPIPGGPYPRFMVKIGVVRKDQRAVDQVNGAKARLIVVKALLAPKTGKARHGFPPSWGQPTCRSRSIVLCAFRICLGQFRRWEYLECGGVPPLWFSLLPARKCKNEKTREAEKRR